MIGDDWKPLRSLGVFTRRSGSEILLESYIDAYSVNETGAYIWSLVGGGRAVKEIVDAVAEHYSVDRAKADEVVKSYLGTLLERGFIQADPESG
ncbi:PqqD family protein [Actinomadura sp. KC216]|uniref:PqqD family protein n=1 Tax=Actinomadura sp. KC216 TaxID=2530370 RepID=UPI001404FB04|nr:PqqD family protein [Actinomadura sp. KC216]